MRIVYPSGVLEIDFVTRAFKNSTPFPLNEAFTETAAGRDPLGTSVAGFVAAVRGLSPRPVVTGEEAARALALELIAFCKTELADVKCPRSIDFRVELPRHPTGKLYKRLLKDEYWANAGRSI